MTTGDLVGGKYRITQRLGVSATGTVWAAINERTGRKVALKILLDPTDDLRYRLLREARACGSLEHRNIVEIHDVGETESGDPFLVMQLLSGETLADLLSRKRRIEPGTAAAIGRDIASALAAAHEARIVHRALEPAKIFLHREGGQSGEEAIVLKVLDLGVSQSPAPGDGRAAGTGTVVDSPAYLSPEQIQRAADVDPRADIWSLGVILFELLTGERPFQGDADEIARQILTAPIPTLASRFRHVPPELDAIVTRCLARDRDERYPDARELSRALAALATAAPGGAEPRPDPVYSPGPSVADARATAKTIPEIRRPGPTRAEAPPEPAGPTIAARVPVWYGSPRLAVAAVILIATLLLLLAIRGAPTTAGPPPASSAQSEAPPPPSGPAPTVEISPADGGPAAVVAASPPPPKRALPRAPQPTLASGNPLQPCTRLVRRNCRLVQP
jgi:serine/threonine-protein kinase